MSPNPVKANSKNRSLTCRITIDGTPEHLFELWTDPTHIERWWGPEGVDCPFAEVDLRVGGEYRIANRLEDGTVIWISGQFEEIAPPSKLVYSWRTSRGKESNGRGADERVTVTFNKRGDHTEVSVLHELIPDEDKRASHELGWKGCLRALESYVLSTESTT